jgi:hypothetical protein
MLSAISRAARTLVYDLGSIDPLDVDVTFEAPSREWAASVTRPSINFFLFDVHESTDRRDGTPQTTVAGGRARRCLPPRRIDLSYMVSVLTGDVNDEHELLWRVMKTLMKHPQFPSEVLAEDAQTASPPIVARVATRDDSRNLLEIWNAFGVEPHPALCYVVTAPMDLTIAVEAPLVLTRAARHRRMNDREADAAPAGDEVRIQIAGTVRNGAGEPLAGVTVLPEGSGRGVLTALDGRYVLRGLSQGIVRLVVSRRDGGAKPVQLQVPSRSYDIVLDGE